MTRKMKIGVIGNGKGSNRYHIPFILTRKDTMEIKWIHARHISHDTWPVVEGAQYTTDINDLLNDRELDLIIISTPSKSHYPLTKQVLESGHNVVCDKPFCETVEQAKELFALAEEKGVMVQCYQNRRFDSDFLTTQKVIESGKLGQIYEIEAHYDYYRADMVDKVNFFDPINSQLYGHACHTLDQIISYFGIPDSHHADIRQINGPGRMNDYFDIDLYYGNLKVVVASSYYRIKSRPKFIVYGKKGMFVKQTEDRQEEHMKLFYMPQDGHPDFGLDRPQEFGVITYMDDEGHYHEEKIESLSGDYARYYDAVYETVMNGAPQLVKPEETICQIGILEEGIKQCK